MYYIFSMSFTVITLDKIPHTHIGLAHIFANKNHFTWRRN